RLVDHKRRIELHLQLRANGRGEDEWCSVEGTFDANALPNQVGIGAVEVGKSVAGGLELRLQLLEGPLRQRNVYDRMKCIIQRHVYEQRIAGNVLAAVLVPRMIVPSAVVIIRFGFANAVGSAGAIELQLS